MFLQPIAIAAYFVVCTFGAAVLGMVLRFYLPDHHLRDDSKDVVKLVMGLIATLVALVLGLLIASANSYYNTQRDELQTLSANIVNLDQALARYGPEADATRAAFHEVVVASHDRMWRTKSTFSGQPAPQQESALSVFRNGLLSLTPATDVQRHLLAQATGLSDNLLAMRLLMSVQIGNSMSWPFLFILVFWVSVLFLGFGLLSERNGTLVAALLVGSVAVGSATFLILELNQPYTGLLALSDAPLQQAIAQFAR
jgi:hypothetical protein